MSMANHQRVPSPVLGGQLVAKPVGRLQCWAAAAPDVKGAIPRQCTCKRQNGRLVCIAHRAREPQARELAVQLQDSAAPCIPLAQAATEDPGMVSDLGEVAKAGGARCPGLTAGRDPQPFSSAADGSVGGVNVLDEVR